MAAVERDFLSKEMAEKICNWDSENIRLTTNIFTARIINPRTFLLKTTVQVVLLTQKALSGSSPLKYKKEKQYSEWSTVFLGVSNGTRTLFKSLYIRQKRLLYIFFALFVEKIVQFCSIFLLSCLSDMSVNILRHCYCAMPQKILCVLCFKSCLKKNSSITVS